MKTSYQFGLYRDVSESPELSPNDNVSNASKCQGRIKCVSTAAIASVISLILICLFLVGFAHLKPPRAEIVAIMSNMTTPSSRNSSNMTTSPSRNSRVLKPRDTTNSSRNVDDDPSTVLNATVFALNATESESGKVEPQHLVNPRPFVFEYTNPFPVPFQKLPPHLNYYPLLTKYRLSTQMKNLQELIKYITSKGGKSASVNIDAIAPKIKFAGVYKQSDVENDLRSDQSVNNNVVYKKDSSALIDLNPGDVNLLAERKFRFSPGAPDVKHENHKYELNLRDNRPLPVEQSRCYGYDCKPKVKSKDDDEILINKPFSVMLDVFPIDDTDDDFRRKRPIYIKPQPPYINDRIYNKPVRLYPSPYTPQWINNAQFPDSYNTPSNSKRPRIPNDQQSSKMMVHLNVYPRQTQRSKPKKDTTPTKDISMYDADRDVQSYVSINSNIGELEIFNVTEFTGNIDYAKEPEIKKVNCSSVVQSVENMADVGKVTAIFSVPINIREANFSNKH